MNNWFIFRLFWICVILGCLYGLQFGYRIQINRYLDHKAVTKDTIRHEDTLKFPAVTICSSCLIRNNSFKDDMERQLVMDIQSGANVSKLIDKYGREYLRRVNIDEVYRRHCQSYDEMFLDCHWTRRDIDCSKRFQNRKIHYQHCYTFNGGGGHQDQDGDDADIGTVSALGPDNGLYMILFANQDNCFISENRDAGFRIVIHDQDQEPDMRRSTYLSPGFSYYLGLSKLEMKLMPHLIKFLGDETCFDMKTDAHRGRERLKHFPKYSYSACEAECMIGYVQKECGCSHISMPGSLVRKCDLLEAVACAYRAEALFYRESAQHMEHCGCPLPCDYTVYNSKLSFAYFPNYNFLQQLGREGTETSLDIEYVRANYLSVNIFYETKVVTTKEQILEFPKEDLIASLSGYLGLAVGASALTGVEFVELLLLLLFKFFKRQ